MIKSYYNRFKFNKKHGIGLLKNIISLLSILYVDKKSLIYIIFTIIGNYLAYYYFNIRDISLWLITLFAQGLIYEVIIKGKEDIV